MAISPLRIGLADALIAGQAIADGFSEASLHALADGITLEPHGVPKG